MSETPSAAKNCALFTADCSLLTATIVAVSSPPGRSLRGLVRLSGDEAFEILGGLLAEPLPAPRRITPNRLRDPAMSVLAAVFPGPGSYTGQDVAELQLPGHPALLDRVVRAALGRGARPAEAGEFTFRAYTAGRMDLTRAEGVAATIHAVSDGQLAAAAHLREGELARFAAERVEALGRLLALVESGIDFVDQEDVVPIAPPDLARQLTDERRLLEDLLSRSRSWGAIEALPRVVLEGPPSAGKSTLFNALLGRPRAVTDAAPGTTRDVLEEPWDLGAPRLANQETAGAQGQTPGGEEVMLVDLAGLDDPRDRLDRLDREVQARGRRAIERADLVLLTGPAGSVFRRTWGRRRGCGCRPKATSKPRATRRPERLACAPLRAKGSKVYAVRSASDWASAP